MTTLANNFVGGKATPQETPLLVMPVRRWGTAAWAIAFVEMFGGISKRAAKPLKPRAFLTTTCSLPEQML